MLLRLRIYAIILWIFFALHVAVICACSFVIFDYVSDRTQHIETLKSQTGEMQKLRELDSIAVQLTQLPISAEKERYHLARVWNEKRNQIGADEIGEIAILKDDHDSKDIYKSKEFIERRNSYLHRNHLETLEKLSSQKNQLLYFVLLPVFLFAVLTALGIWWVWRKIVYLRTRVQTLVLDTVLSIKSLHGEYAKPFQNPEFWLQIGLLAAEKSTELFRHPLADFLSETSRLTREELQKTRSRETK